MAARRAIRNINWPAIAERMSESEKNAFIAFKTKSDLYLRRVNENPETSPKIDWAFYKTKVGVPGLVDKFQKEYESLKISYPEDKYTSQLDAQEKESLQAVEKFIQESNQRIKDNLSEIENLEGLLKYGQMTLEDFRDAHPDIALDPINKPSIYPHTPDCQPDTEDTKPVASSH